jgi:hypothetical protein
MPCAIIIVEILNYGTGAAIGWMVDRKFVSHGVKRPLTITSAEALTGHHLKLVGNLSFRDAMPRC